MKIVKRLYQAAFVVVALVFAAAGLVLVGFAGGELWTSIWPVSGGTTQERFEHVLETIALLTIAVASLELSQTILEEEVLRQAHIGAPTRARRFLSRYMVVIIVALGVEVLVGVFRFMHEEPASLVPTAILGFATAALLAAWGVFLRLNRSVEELEPDALADAKREDEQMKENS